MNPFFEFDDWNQNDATKELFLDNAEAFAEEAIYQAAQDFINLAAWNGLSDDEIFKTLKVFIEKCKNVSEILKKKKLRF